MTKLAAILRNIVHELDRTHQPSGFTGSFKHYLPNFVVTRAGVERHFTAVALAGLNELSRRMYAERPDYCKTMREQQFAQLLRRCLADLHSEGSFVGVIDEGRGALKLLEQEMKTRLAGLARAFRHGFPAVTLGLEKDQPFQVGPVDIRTVESWLDDVRLNEKEYLRHDLDAGSDWKADVLAALRRSQEIDSTLNAHPRGVEEAFSGSNAVASVAVFGLEQTYSREVARLVVRTALDGLSLLAGSGRIAFSKQVLTDERMQSARIPTIFAMGGEHWISSNWSERSRPISTRGIKRRVFGESDRYVALCDIVACQLDSRSHRHPQLAMRWAAALEWYAEGCREVSSSVAVTKLAAALDILTCGKTKDGIVDMLSRLLEQPADAQVFEGVPESLSQIVQAIYGHGRSQLLHGNQVDRLVPFDTERGQAQALGELALVLLLERLAIYKGPDCEDAFIAMPL